MENKDTALSIEKDSQIQVVVNSPGWEDDSIDLGRVFRNFKKKKRIYVWVLVLCVVIGLCAPLLIYQFTRDPLTVSSVVTLQYDVPYVEEVDETATTNTTATTSTTTTIINTVSTSTARNSDKEEMVPVSDLTAPDGKSWWTAP